MFVRYIALTIRVADSKLTGVIKQLQNMLIYQYIISDIPTFGVHPPSISQIPGQDSCFSFCSPIEML